jgi:Lon protease-like protein
MSRLGLFPLSLVLVPTERVPLHVFEPRYKELVGECIEQGEEFGVVLQADEGEAHDVGTRAAVAEVLQVLPDGRMNVVIEGGDRFRLLDLHHDRPFLSADVEEVVDEDDPPDPDDVERALEVFVQLQQTVGSPAEPPDTSSPLFDWEVVSRVDFGAQQKQELIEIVSPRLRYPRLVELLEHALEALSLEREVRQRASGNGKVPSPGDADPSAD